MTPPDALQHGIHAHSGHAHVPRAAGDPDGLRLGIAYDRLTRSLQVVSAQFILLTTERSLTADPRDAGDARGLLLDDARSVLDEVVPAERDRALLAVLRRCLADLEALAASLRAMGGPLADPAERDRFVRRLREVASRLARCADHEHDLTFFGSGGCADSEHRYLHI